jgi:hypothetical protein
MIAMGNTKGEESATERGRVLIQLGREDTRRMKMLSMRVTAKTRKTPEERDEEEKRHKEKGRRRRDVLRASRRNSSRRHQGQRMQPPPPRRSHAALPPRSCSRGPHIRR